MTNHGVTELVVEQAALAWFEATGWQIGHGPEIAPDITTGSVRGLTKSCWASDYAMR